MMKKSILILAGCVLAVILFHKPLILVGARVVLHRFPALSYETLAWEEGSLVLRSLAWKEEDEDLTIDEVRLEGLCRFQRGGWAPQITLIHPQLSIETLDASSPRPLLGKTRSFQPEWRVTSGVLQLPGSRFYFSYLPHEGGEQLLLSHQPDLQFLPLLKADLAQEERALRVAFEWNEPDLSLSAPLLGFLLPEWQMTLSGEGSASGEGVINAAGEIQEVTLLAAVTQLQIEGALSLSLSEASLSCVYLPEEDSLGALCSVQGASYDHLSDVDVNITLYPHESLQATAQGLFEKTPFSMQMDAAVEGGILRLEHCTGQVGELRITAEAMTARIEGVVPGLAVATPVDLHVVLEGDEESWHASVSGRVYNDEIESSFSFSKHTLSLQEGVVQIPRLQLHQGTPWVQPFLPGLKLEGVAACAIVLFPDHLEMTLQPETLTLYHPKARFYQSAHERDPWHCSWNWTSGAYAFEGEIAQGEVGAEVLPWPVESFSGKIMGTRERLEIPHFSALWGGIEMQGRLTLDPEGLQLITSEIIASDAALQTLASRFPGLPPFTGEFRSKERGLVVSLHEGGVPTWALTGAFSHLSLPLKGGTMLREGRCEVEIDSDLSHLVIDKGGAEWELLDGSLLSLQMQRLSFDQRASVFSLRVVEGKKEFAKLAGRLLATPSGWEIAFDPKETHIATLPLQVETCVLTPQFALSTCSLKPQLKLEELPALLRFLAQTGWVPPFNTQELSALGKVQLSLTLQEGWTMEASSSDCKVGGTLIAPLFLKARTRGGEWTIDALQTSLGQGKGILRFETGGVALPRFEILWNGLTAQGSALFKEETRQLHCTLDTIKGALPASLPFKGTASLSARGIADFSTSPSRITGEVSGMMEGPLRVRSKKQIPFRYTAPEGWVIEGCDLQIQERAGGVSLAQLQTARILVPKGGIISAQGLKLSVISPQILNVFSSNLAPLHWEGEAQLTGDLQLTQSQWAFQGHLSPGRYGWGETNLTLDQIQIARSPDSLQVRVKTSLEQQPLWGLLKWEGDEGALTLFDHPKAEGLKFTLRSGGIEGILGSCYGLECHLKTHWKRKSCLTGEIKADLSRLSRLLPPALQKGLEPLKLGAGYAWEGDLVLGPAQAFTLSGKLKGSQVEALGYQFESLQALLEATPQKIQFSDLKLQEGLGKIAMQKVELTLNKGIWGLYIPTIDIHHLQPSTMRKVGVPQGSVKPFIIEHLSLSEIRAEIGDVASLKGWGHLTFVNQFKKEASLFDLPLEMIKRIGLDLGQLTPVEGELQVELRGDKFYLLSLERAYSEAQRSEFYLAKTASYIDLAGGVHIDLKMHQDVMLKVVEPFTLTIRGTLDKPRYGLQF